MVQTTEKLPPIRRVDVITGAIGLGNSTIGVSVRYLIAEGRCEIRIQYWFRLTLGFKTITISASTEWQGCDDGIATAIALAEKFDASEIQLCDPDAQITDARFENMRQKMNPTKATNDGS